MTLLYNLLTASTSASYSTFWRREESAAAEEADVLERFVVIGLEKPLPERWGFGLEVSTGEVKVDPNWSLTGEWISEKEWQVREERARRRRRERETDRERGRQRQRGRGRERVGGQRRREVKKDRERRCDLLWCECEKLRCH
jgi:hypothetical protein